MIFTCMNFRSLLFFGVSRIKLRASVAKSGVNTVVNLSAPAVGVSHSHRRANGTALRWPLRVAAAMQINMQISC